MAEVVLEMKNITKEFPGVKALNNVNIDLRKGEVLGIVGENGAGKSTLMKVLSGTYSHDQYTGEIWVDGKKQQFNSVADGRNAGICMIYQEVSVMFDSSVAENVFVNNLPGKGLFVDYPKLYGDTQVLLDRVGLAVNPKTIVRKLNAGQLQLMSIVRGIAANPHILVFDEPSTALTDSEVDLLMDFLDRLRKDGVSCIYISHKLEEIYRICDRVTVIRDGQTIATRDAEDWNEADLIENMIGRKVENMYTKTPREFGEPVLEVEDLVVPHPTIKNRNIVDYTSFKLRKGEILGIGGLVGAGRSETLEAIFGKTTEGVSKKVKIHGKEVTINTPQDAIKAGIGFATEERKLTGFVDTMDIMYNISLASLDDIPGKLFVDTKAETEEVVKHFERLRVKAPSLHQMVVNLSGGNQQKVILAKWLMKNPDILFIDEPTKGIDVGTKSEFYKILDELANEGVSIVMVSSDMPELISVSDRVIVMCEGKITGELDKGELTQANVMRLAITK
ncbi:sugar ABC transporter ATP-binding protein [Lachnospiraceae bacterium]|nr:sugar ABC transporter ATP-binding protein [Lachnospiraceae bacterium]